MDELEDLEKYLVHAGHIPSRRRELYWVDTQEFQAVKPPTSLPDRRFTLVLPQQVTLTFSEDSLYIYLARRWRLFVTDLSAHAIVVRAFGALARALGGLDGIILHDETDIMDMFRTGGAYAACLASVRDKHGERASITYMQDATEQDHPQFYHVYCPFLEAGRLLDASYRT